MHSLLIILNAVANLSIVYLVLIYRENNDKNHKIYMVIS